MSVFYHTKIVDSGKVLHNEQNSLLNLAKFMFSIGA